MVKNTLKERPFISVIVPTFMRHEYLIATVRALQKQDYPHFEIIVVDQSPQGLVPQNAWPERRGQVQYVRQRRPSMVYALNIGIAHARGDVVLCTDDDIIPSTDLLTGHAECYANSEVGMVLGRVVDRLNSQIDPDSSDYVQSVRRLLGRSALTPNRLVWMLVGCNLSVRREVLESAGGFDNRFIPPFNHNETELGLRVSRLGYHIVFSRRARVEHLLAPSSGAGNRKPSLARHYGSMFNLFLMALKHPDSMSLREAFWFRAAGSPVKTGVAVLALCHVLVVLRRDGMDQRAQ